MLKSMTGFGRGSAERDSCKLLVEIKSVNNRYFDAYIRMPKELSSLELALRKRCQKQIARGKLEISVSWSQLQMNQEDVVSDLPLAKSYADQIRRIAREIGVGGMYMPDPYEIASFPNVLKSKARNADVDFWSNLLEEASEAAIRNLIQMREEEGERLSSDLDAKLADLRKHRESVLALAPETIQVYRERLREKLTQLLGDRADEIFGENRLAAEVLVYADKASVDEELVRLDSHLNSFSETLKHAGSQGKKLDFLIQEMNREINTVGSKSDDIRMTAIVVEMKTVLEKIREQVQNIE